MKPTGPGKNRDKRNADYFKYSSRTLNTKYRSVQQSRLKRQFQKSVRAVADDTPDYIRQILANEVTDADDAILPRRTSQKPNANESDHEPAGGSERPNSKVTPTVSEESTAPTDARPASAQSYHRNSNGTSTRGLNPYQRALKKAQTEKLRKEEEYEKKEQEFQETQAARKTYFKKRAKEHQAMSQKTQRGQLKLSSQVNLLLRKIQPK
ncbi:hypothetical protein H4R34_002834 [Dimargaris verticillata]|uniref:rRNA-processing protein FYV7 n=1 Tax=Dimargaris verticillata TaxID=2761393 RepID=A0A9W8B833_9FUNG|nr:hypothetical protein H4R34_002834 [Dimargaris verticillata]